MKKMLISKSNDKIFVLKIIVDFYENNSPFDSDIAASETRYIKDPMMKKNAKFSEYQIKTLDDVISQIMNIVKNNGFKDINDWQSPKSYSYYISFIPTKGDGSEWPYKAKFQLETRDHGRNDNNSEGGWVSNSLYVSVFNIGDKTCFDVGGVVESVREICNELKQGDYSSLEPVPITNTKN